MLAILANPVDIDWGLDVDFFFFLRERRGKGRIILPTTIVTKAKLLAFATNKHSAGVAITFATESPEQGEIGGPLWPEPIVLEPFHVRPLPRKPLGPKKAIENGVRQEPR
jgi:hypothetical protein